MSENRLYSVAAIAKLLDMPESTLHYWKNRFDAVLPSVGRGRSKRFRPEAVEVFQAIGRLLGQGLSAADVRAELMRQFPVNATHEPTSGTAVSAVAAHHSAATTVAAGEAAFSGGEPAVMAMAAGIGTEIARSIMAQFQRHFPPVQPALPEETVEGLREQLGAMRDENAAMAEKMRLLEAELVRLRKDRRELENYLVDKINALRRADETS
ncbi:putative transcriptional regulator, MerR family [Solidesulfovibrio fructosivorans JJ]]|uniref:Putative transcriptional regulator, MerR family n=1 Tax=Solidesulfovibrio fructosivorans JJ] TaxID=596151 RepID=E1JSH4_SOLFR|nr:helix-turn-helix domain-containing protein [Solidesulfovibrio fructosivorans]EFL52943.1 putative transcriptional regulator, MerR family [Solidesulfovibrio fructosivorans JJ]]